MHSRRPSRRAQASSLTRIASASLAFLLPAAPCLAFQDSLFHDVRESMGTTVDMLLWAPSLPRAEELFEVAFEEIAYVDATLSTYRANSEVTRINGAAAHGAVVVDPEVYRLLEQSRAYGRRTDGAFDITVGPLVRAWGFHGGPGRMPSRRALARARERSGWPLLALDAAQRSVRFRREGVELDFGAIGKGWALDRAAAALRRFGVTAALLGIGGSSYYAIGTPPGRDGWAIRITDPADTASIVATVLLRDASLATSGASQQFFEVGGRRYSHIIDPRTGWPVEGMLQVTVTAETATESDALATALFVLGPVGSTDLLDEPPGGGALFIRDTTGAARIVKVRWPDEW